MNAPLKDKVAVVTGGSGTIGSAIIAGLEREGARAVSLDVARPATGGGLYQVCDVGDDNSVGSALAAVQRECGRLDLVVHTA
ncbi:MAG: SDR family NAD(P)-dependent oxidoreductase, partial [Ktedonobacterales bacterium]